MTLIVMFADDSKHAASTNFHPYSTIPISTLELLRNCYVIGFEGELT